MKRTASINQYLAPLAKSTTQAYLTNELQVADIIEWIVAQNSSGANVWITTFSISEEFLRRLYFLRAKNEKINRLVVLLDRKATNKTINLWSFIKQVIQEAYLADNHSKLMLVQFEDGQCVSVVTSQNLTRGNRSESALVTTEQGVFDTLKKQLDNLITYHSIPLHELYERATGECGEDGFSLHIDNGHGVDNED